MSNPFEKYVQASQRQNNNLAVLTEGLPQMRATHVNTLPVTTDPTLKSVGDYLGDTATDAAKALLTAQGVAVSAVDLGMYSLGGLGSLAQTIGHTVAPDTIPEVQVPEYGVGSKALNDTFGVNIADAKQYWGNQFYSDARKKQEAELQAGYTEQQMGDWKKSWEDSYATQLTGLQKSGATEQQLKDFNDGFNKQYQEAAKQFIASKQTSWDKSLGENASIVGDTFGYVADNPSLGVGAAIDSMGYLVPSLAVSKGVLALQNAAKAASVGGKAIAAGVGEGSISSLAIAEQMRNNSNTGTIGGGKLLAAAAAGTLTGLIGGASNKLGARLGLEDIDTAGLAALGTGAATRLPALTRPIAAIGQEGGEEFLQGFGETIIPNIAEGKDPLQGLNQELALGTFAGGIMGAGMNTKGLVTGAASDIKAGFNVVGDATKLKSFETLSNPEHKNYNPAQAFNLQLKNLESADEAVRTQAEASVSKIETDLDTARASVEERIKSIQATLKAMPPSDQTTDAQKLKIEALRKEYSELTTKSSTLADQYVAFIEAQVTAQEHRDAQQGTQFTEEQAKADIATLTQPIPSQTVWSNQDTDIPVEVIGEPEVDEQGNEFTKVRYTPQEGADPIESYVPTSELVSTQGNNDVAQQEALDRVTRHFSKYSNDDLDLLATSPVFNEQQRNSLRLMSKSKRELAAVQDPSQVFDNILNGYKGKTIQESHRGLNQYTDMVNTAVATKNEQLATLALDGLGAFTDDHTAKKDAINEAFGLVQKGTYKEIRVVRTEDGTWGFVPFTAQEVRAGKNADGVVFLEDDALKEELNSVGGFNVHRNSDTPTKGRTIGAITQINNETQLIQDRFNALSGVAESFVGVTPKPVDTSIAPTVDTPIITEPSDTTAPIDSPAPEVPVQSDVVSTQETPIPSQDTPDVTEGDNQAPTQITENTGKDTTEVGFKLTPTGQYTPKDQLKADKATKFIGEGAANSSTAQYAKDAGDKANTGKYTKNDVVFISVNGARANRQAPNLVEIQKAIDAGATILTDKLSDRERSFNVGEREVAAHLTKNGYVEEGNTGVWKPKAETAEATPPVVSGIKIEGNNTLVTSVVSGLTHSVPTKLVDKMLTVKHEIASILQITSGYLNEKQLKYVKELLTAMIGLNDTIRVGFYADLNKVNDVAIRDRLRIATGTSSGTRIYIDLTNSRPLDILELLTHEYHHAVTAQIIASITDPEHPVYKALDGVKQALKDFMATDPKMSGHIKSRFANMQKNFKELITTGTTEPQVIARLRTIPITDTKSAYDILVEQSIAVMKMQNPKQFTPELEAKLNDIFHIGRGQATGNAESSSDSQSQSSSQAIDSSSQDNTGDTIQDRPSDTGTTGQQDRGSGEAVLGTESQDVPTRLATGEQTTTEPVATEDAKVTVLQGVTDEVAAEERKKPFNLRNILKGYFTQSTTKEDAVGANPLVTVKDFLSNFDVRTQVGKWLNDRRKPTLKQLEQVEHFKKFHAEFAKALKFVFNTQASAKYVSNMENLVGYLEMGKKASTRELDENVVTALALSAYSYLIKQGNKVMNTNEELETLFRLKKGVRAPLEIEQMFRFAGQEMPIVVKALGTDAAKALGLKVREDQDPTLQDRLNTSLGILAMEAMAKAGFVVIDTLEDNPKDETDTPLTDFLTAIKTVRKSKAYTSEDEYDFEVDTDVETKISKFTLVRPNAKMEGEGNSVFKKGIIETEVDGKIVRTETITLNRPVLTKGLPTLNSSLVNELIEANKDTKGFLSYLFGVDVGLTTPLKEIPKKFTQRLINGTDASVPSVQAELLTEAQKHSFTMRTNTVAVFAAMQKLGENSQFLKELLGIWIDDHVLSRTHVTERDSLQAKAQNDWTAVLNGLEWADATLDENGEYTQFYVTQFVAQNQRQHLNSKMFSAQSSQIHRAMAALTGFSTTIDLSQDGQGTVKDEALLNLFYQAVGEGLEGLDDYLKADILSKAEAGLHQFFTVDKVYGDYYVPALKAFLETTESKSAIEAMRALIETGTINTDQQEAIAAFVNKGKMGAQSLQSLIALAELSIAQPSGTFTTTTGFGSDGVNHGVSAANMLTGVISKDMRQQTGIFPIAEKGQDQISNMQEVYKRKITDYYVDFGKVMSRKLRDLVGTLVGKLNTDFVQGMTALFPKFEVLDDTGELKNLLDMRKIAKIWAIPFNYSAGKAALQRALARGFLAGIYGNMNKLANEALDIIDAKKKEGLTAEQLAALDVKLETVKLKTDTLQDNLNKVLSKYGMSVTLPEPQLLNEEAQGKLSNGLENTLMQAAIDLHGEAAWQATEEFAKDYLEVRNVYTEVEKASFTLFDVVRNQLIEEKKASRKYTNVNAKVQVKGKTVQYTAEELNAQEAEYFGLTTVETAEVDAALAAMRPIFNTALSIGSESTNAADSVTNPSGVSVRKHKMQREPAKGLRAVNTFYLKEIDANGKPFSEARNIGLTKEVEENAGVASSANAVQSIDAYVAAKVQGFMDALNVHDAAIFGLKDFLKGVKKQNEEHLKALTNYQLGLEHAKMLVKVYQGYKAFMATQEEALKSEDVMVKENAQKLITKTKKQMEVLLWGEQMFKGDTALKINNELVYKGGLIPKLQAANLDIKDSASIEEATSVFINYALKQDLQKLEVLLDTYSIHQFAGEGGMHQLTKADKASIEKQKALVQKALLDLDTELNGKPAPMNTTEAVKPTTKLAEFLRKAKGAVIDITSLIEHLTNNTDINDLKARAAQLEVLKAITPLIDKAIKVIYSEGDYDGYGYYDEETNTLHINSAKEAEGGVRSTLAVHELLHAALSSRIKTLNASIETKEAEAKKTGKEVSFTSAEVALRNLEKLRVNLVTPDGMRMLELQAELGSAIEDSTQFYRDTEELYESQKTENVSTIKELQALNKEEARRDEIEREIKKRGTSIGAAYKAQLEAELKTLTPKAELDTKRNALLAKQQAMRDTKALLDKANKYFELRETLSKKVLSERTRKDGSSSKFTQLNLVEMLTNIDEFISYGLTESRLQEAMKSTQVDRGGRTFSAKLRKFVEFVGQVLGFRTHQISALAAFASDTADLLSAIGSVTPVVASNNGERLFSTQSAEDLVNGQSSLDIMQALPHSNTGAFNQQLDRLITEEIGQLYNQDDAAKARIDEIQTFTASDALNAGFTLSRKEQYVQQALQYAVAAYMKLHAGGANVGQLRRVYHAAKVKMDVTGKDFHEGDWSTATQQEQDLAKAKYDFMFDSTKEGYMDRFVSMALASESVSKILDIALPLTKPETQDKTWFETVNDWVSYVMAWLTNKYVRLNPVAGASNQLVQLMDNLVKLDIRARQESVSFHQKAWNSIGIITTPLNAAWKETRGFLISDKVLANSRFLSLRALGAAITLRSEAAAKAIPKLIIDMRNNELPHTKLGEAALVLMEAASAGTMRDASDVLSRQANLNAKKRQEIVDNVKKAVISWFKTELTKAQHKAMTYGLLRPDAQALLEDYSVEDIVDMALHEGKLNAEIAKLKKEIAKNPNGNGMLNAADKLGYYMVTRIGGKGLVKGVLGIAMGLGMQYQTSVEQADPKLVHQLDMLVSMLAMSHVSNSDKAILAALYKADKDGVHAVINFHSGLVKEATPLFEKNPLSKVKGWMPEITDTFREIKTANSMVERAQMEKEGWKFIGELQRDANDKGDTKYLMKHNDIGYQRYVSGSVDLMEPSRSGTEAIDRTNPKYLGIVQARYRDAARLAAIPNSTFDPSKEDRGLIAAYDTDGVALGFNYEMDNETRDAHLDRNHNIGDLLGTFGGNTYYVPAKARQSNAVAQVLFEDYRDNYSQNPNAYLKLSPKSTDPKVVEMWRMLPTDFKQQATALYGKGNPIIMRNEAFNFAFGFKKFSVVSNAFDAVNAERARIKMGLIGTGKSPNKFQSAFVGFAELVRKDTPQADFAKAEHVVQEIMKFIKDSIVIRSVTTLKWNIFANVCLLMANGINPVTIIKDWVFAVTNVRAYQKLNSQLIQAQADLVAGKEPTALKQKIGALKAELKANPLNEYINAGLLSSIVEDVTIQKGDYTYNSAFKQAVDEKTQWIPKPVKTAAKVLAIAPSTKLYQFLATTTQLSDFVAKYSLSKHLQENGVSVDEAMIEASKTFINYDLPTSQGLQYANDMGLFMFTKFFLRVQAVLFKLLGKKAGSVIAQHLLVESLTGAEGILSPLIFKHATLMPIDSSILGLPSAVASIASINVGLDLL